jgi:hypothetical protein
VKAGFYVLPEVIYIPLFWLMSESFMTHNAFEKCPKMAFVAALIHDRLIGVAIRDGSHYISLARHRG